MTLSPGGANGCPSGRDALVSGAHIDKQLGAEDKCSSRTSLLSQGLFDPEVPLRFLQADFFLVRFNQRVWRAVLLRKPGG
jgi:hypothetical protein